MIAHDEIAAVLVTRGDHPEAVDAIIDSLPFDQVVVWDNSRRPFNAKVFGRYLAVLETTRPVIAIQDDDCIVTCWDTLRANYEDGSIVANMVSGHRPGEPPMLGWGALFARDLPWLAFDRWLRRYPFDWEMTGYPETIFTALTPCVRLNIGTHEQPLTKGHIDLPHATYPTRSYRQPRHYVEFEDVLERATAVAQGKRTVREVYAAHEPEWSARGFALA